MPARASMGKAEILKILTALADANPKKRVWYSEPLAAAVHLIDEAFKARRAKRKA